ncbi:MAG TPA: RHS repeat protein [Arsenophonus nasoniae]
MSTLLFSKTPTITVADNRGLSVRDIAYYRHPDTPNNTEQRITHHQYNARGFLAQSADPRLYERGLTNFAYQTNLLGNVLRTQSADAGITLALSDIAGRPFIAISNIGVYNHGEEDISQAVTHTFQYEDASLPGRQLSITEQVTTEATRVTERFIWAGNTEEEQRYNLVDQCVSHYDTAGLVQTDSIALSGIPLAVTRKLLKEADRQETIADWQGNDPVVWNQQLDDEPYTTQVTADATGRVLTTIDARGNLQRMAYDVAGLLMSSWLTVKDGQEQVIVQSLTYSAAGQKLREEHGNGVVTMYTYEPETQRLMGIKAVRPAGHIAGMRVLQDLRYEYDPVGNVLNIRNDAEETRFWRNQKIVPENTYSYDSLYQLVNATGREMADIPQQSNNLPPVIVPLSSDNSTYTNYFRTYSYDTGGNLTQIRHSAPASNNNYTINITISDRSNRGVSSTLTEDPTEVDALFTAAGHQRMLLPGQHLNWTPRGELQKVTPVTREDATDDNEYYRYAADSQRILKINRQVMGNSVRGQRVQYLPGLELRSTANDDVTSEIFQVITIGEAGRAQVQLLHWEIGEPPAINGNNQLRYSYDNLIGSSCMEVDGDGFIISLEEYYPYGGTAIWTARSQIEADYKTIRYSGKERDATGLYYYGYRYYQPWVGRWLSADPAGAVDGLNLFWMVRNNPITLMDADGLISIADRIKQLELASQSNGEMQSQPIASKRLSIPGQFSSRRNIMPLSEVVPISPKPVKLVSTGSDINPSSTAVSLPLPVPAKPIKPKKFLVLPGTENASPTVLSESSSTDLIASTRSINETEAQTNGTFFYRGDDRSPEVIKSAGGFFPRSPDPASVIKKRFIEIFSFDAGTLAKNHVTSPNPDFVSFGTTLESGGYAETRNYFYEVNIPDIAEVPISPITMGVEKVKTPPKILTPKLLLSAANAQDSKFIAMMPNKSVEATFITPVPYKYITRYKNNRTGGGWINIQHS